MISIGAVEAVLPHPIKIELSCNMEKYESLLNEALAEVVITHNKQHDTKIENFIRPYEYEIESDVFRVLVGGEEVLVIKCPEIFGDDSDINSYLVSSVKQVLNIWHDKIIKLQNINEKKIEQLKEEEYYEMLYAYYSIRSDGRAFKYLKKLVNRYPNTRYKGRLKRIYQNGYSGWHKKNVLMAKKLNQKQNYGSHNF